jgi:hypothetical protein
VSVFGRALLGLVLTIIQSLECQLNTLGIRGALHESVVGKQVALAKYARAVEQGTVSVVRPTYSFDVATDPFN